MLFGEMPSSYRSDSEPLFSGRADERGRRDNKDAAARFSGGRRSAIIDDRDERRRHC